MGRPPRGGDQRTSRSPRGPLACVVCPWPGTPSAPRLGTLRFRALRISTLAAALRCAALAVVRRATSVAPRPTAPLVPLRPALAVPRPGLPATGSLGGAAATPAFAARPVPALT